MIEAFKRVLAANLERCKRHLDRAICSAALNIRLETDKLVPYGDNAVAVFNSHADEIDRKFGKGFFGVRLVRLNALSFRVDGKPALASVRLDYLQATDPNPVYQWMSDLLFMAGIPEKQLIRQATERGGFCKSASAQAQIGHSSGPGP